jgi:cobalamin biosynthesis protein CbiD
MSRGTALPSVLFTVALIGVSVVGGVFAARSSVAAARLEQLASDVEWRTESALIQTLTGWDTTARVTQAVGQTQVQAISGVAVRITRLAPTLYFCFAEFSASIRPALRRRMSVLVITDTMGAHPLPDRGWTVLP